MDIVKNTIIGMVVFIIAGSIHEFAHALSAFILGDDTARLQGRLTLNPIVHVNIFGSIIFPLINSFTGFYIYGWMKPVPVSGKGFKNPSRDHALVAFAGPLSNFLQIGIAIILLRIIYAIGDSSSALSENLVFKNIQFFFTYYFLINILLFVFNLLPCPPLDGGWILRFFLPEKLKEYFDKFYRFGFILLFILLFTGLLETMMLFMIKLFQNLFILLMRDSNILLSFLPLLGGLIITTLLFKNELISGISHKNQETLIPVPVPIPEIIPVEIQIPCTEEEFSKGNPKCQQCDSYMNCLYKGIHSKENVKTQV